jgi:DNA-binding PadR family transcriptional regulator
MVVGMALAPTRLLVLGIVRLLQPIHGYDVRRELLSWRADEWANVAPGSVYGALNTLERDGWIEPVDTSQEGTRPARTTYRVTDEGEKEFHSLLNDTWSHAHSENHPLLPAVAFMPFSDRDTVLTHLETRALHLEAEAKRARAEIERIVRGTGDPTTGAPYHTAELTRLMLARTDSELTWTRDLLKRLRSGELDPWAMPGTAD